MSIKLFYLSAVAAILSCAPASDPSGMSAADAIPRRSFIITADEIVAAKADAGTLYDAVARLRPNWLAAHGVAAQGSQYAAVFVDGQKYGDLYSLRNIPAYDAAEMRYYDITQAGAVFGIKGDTGGVINIRMKVNR